jgi:hypothetical protein
MDQQYLADMRKHLNKPIPKPKILSPDKIFSDYKKKPTKKVAKKPVQNKKTKKKKKTGY